MKSFRFGEEPVFKAMVETSVWSVGSSRGQCCYRRMSGETRLGSSLGLMAHLLKEETEVAEGCHPTDIGRRACVRSARERRGFRG